VLTEALIALFLAISLDPAVRLLMRWRIQRGSRSWWSSLWRSA
jgi:predicted PurR-regulated permease PerM